MRKINDIRQDLNAAIAEYEAAATAEARDAAMAKVRAFAKELKEANEVESARQMAAEDAMRNAVKKAGRRLSFAKFLRESLAGQLTGLEAEVAEAGREEYRALGIQPRGFVIPSAYLRATGQNAGTAADGGNLKVEGALRYFDALQERLVLTKLGATMLTGLVGNVPMVSDQAVIASWVAEGAAGETKKTSFTKQVMTPHRNSVTMAVTKELLAQTSVDVEQKIMNLILNAHANLLEKAAIAGSGESNEPTGILKTTGIGDVAIGTNGGPITWKKVVELETVVNSKNAGGRGNMAYLTNAKVVGALKSTEKATNTGRFIVSDMTPNTINGYTYDWTNVVPDNLTKGTAASKCSALIFGNFNDLYIGQWGGIDIIADPYTKKKEGEIEFTITALNDVKVARPESFAAIQDITL